MLNRIHDPLVALHEVTLGLLTSDTPEDLLDMILDQAIEFTGADSGSIALLDATRRYLKIKTSRGLGADVADRVRLKVGEGVTGRCILTGKPRLISDTSQDPYYIEVNSNIKSELAVPLSVGKKSFGVISLDSSRLNAFDQSHLEYMQLLASYAGLTFTNKQTISSFKHRTEIQDVLIEVSTYIGKDGRVEDVFKDIMTILEEKIGLTRGGIFLHNKVENELKLVASINYTSDETKKSTYKSGEGITGRVFKTKKFWSIKDISKDVNFLNKIGSDELNLAISFFASPIKLDDETRGVFSMQIPYFSESYFEDYIFLCKVLSALFSQTLAIRKLIEESTKDTETENIELKRRLGTKFLFSNIIGKTQNMRDLFEKMNLAADSPSSVLLIGESGTGKELIANALHHNSIRKKNPLVKINCAAIPKDLLESELFGYVKGAFTGANSEKKGKFLAANTGTLFLDEIGEMDIDLQAKLLRILQEKEFSPLGSNKVFKVEVKIIAATNANLFELVSQKKFREDLYYRLNVLELNIPPLRSRLEDIPLIVSHLVKKICDINNRPIIKVGKEVIEKLKLYDFPGNIRELENIIERAIVLNTKQEITADDIQIAQEVKSFHQEKLNKMGVDVGLHENRGVINDDFRDELQIITSWVKNKLNNVEDGQIQKEVLRDVESAMYKILLKKNLYNKSKTARTLGINRLTLEKKIQEYQLLDNLDD